MERADPLTRLYLRVTGRVQGVGFRWFIRERAEELGASGWARNLEDGSVEAEIEAGAATLAALVEIIRTEHPAARVDSVMTRPADVQGEKGFRIG